MMTPRVQSIIGAMTGRQASQVNDTALRDAVRSTLIDIGTKAGKPLTTSLLPPIIAGVLRTAAKTILFEAEIPIALEMGAAGELDGPTNITVSNAQRWVTTYAVCGDRRAAQEQISLAAARDRKRMDAVTADEQRRDYELNGLARAWDTYCQEGWTVKSYTAAGIYAFLDRGHVRQLLGSDGIAAARSAALETLRRDMPRLYRSAPVSDVEASNHFNPYFKAALVRAYFDALRSAGLTPFNHESHAVN